MVLTLQVTVFNHCAVENNKLTCFLFSLLVSLWFGFHFVATFLRKTITFFDNTQNCIEDIIANAEHALLLGIKLHAISKTPSESEAIRNNCNDKKFTDLIWKRVIKLNFWSFFLKLSFGFGFIAMLYFEKALDLRSVGRVGDYSKFCSIFPILSCFN